MGSIPIPGTTLESTASYEKYLREVKRIAPTTIHDKVRVIRARHCKELVHKGDHRCGLCGNENP